MRVSGLWATPAWPPGIGPDFVNAAVAFERDMPPRALLDRLHGMEAQRGRTRSTRWGIRVLDLDLIASGGQVMPDPETLRHWMALDPEEQGRRVPDTLLLPHPRMQERAFVLIPAAEVAPGWRHPLTGRSIVQMRAALPLTALRGIRRLGPI